MIGRVWIDTVCRGVGVAALALGVCCMPGMTDAAEEVVVSHGIAMHGAPKYGPDFPHFDYVNPAAPQGGELRLATQGTFDSFHGFIPKGNAASTGSVETLLTSSADEAFSEYGLIAESIEYPRDRSWVIFNLRREARWHDGEAITAADVVWSFETLTSLGSPQYRFYYASVAAAEMLDTHRVRFTFSEQGNRELPLIVGQLPILPKHYWENRDFEKTTLEPPLGSGPYRIEEFEAGRYYVQQRVEDYWGRDLPVNVGLNNFDRIRVDFFRDATAIRLALKSGNVDYRAENQAKAWALDYNVPAVEKGWLRKELIPNQLPTGMQGFVMNTRRPVFADVRVREALGYAFDFEWTNENLFFSQYTRTESYFSNSELASRGLPAGEELEILNPYRARLPKRVFDTPYQAPATDGTGWPRQSLRTAFALLRDAGWEVQDMRLVNRETGRQMSFEILLVSPTLERIVLPFTRNLKRLGIDARVRLVDQSQYINRLRSFDYDMFVFTWGQSESPGNEQRSFWGSAAADNPSSRNFAGIRDPVVDELIELVVSAPSRESLVARSRALDRVLLWGFYVIPNWHIQADRILYWDKFSRPGVPVKVGAMITRWWFDEAKAEALGQAKRADQSLTVGQQVETGGELRTKLLWLAALLVIGYFVFRRAWRTRGARP